MILYEETDESEVDIVDIASQSGGPREEFRYPRAGQYRSNSASQKKSSREDDLKRYDSYLTLLRSVTH